MARSAARPAQGNVIPHVPADTNPLGLINWRQAFYANDPAWTKPADGGAVSSWRDGGVMASNAVQGTGANQPTFRAATTAFNNNPTIQFDGGDLLVSTGAAAQAQPTSVVVIGQVTDLGSGSVRLFCDGLTAARMAVGTYQTGTKVRIIGTSALDLNGADTGVHLYQALFNATASSATEDGVSLGTGTTGVAVSPTGMTIGASYLGGNQLVGHIAFVGWFVGDVTGEAGWPTFKQWAATAYGLTIS